MNDEDKTRDQLLAELRALRARAPRLRAITDHRPAPAWRDVTECRRTEEMLRRSQALLTEAQRLAHLGSWERLLPDDAITYSEELGRIFGLDLEQLTCPYQTFLDCVHPDDRASIAVLRERAIRECTPFEQHYRIVRRDGALRTIHARGHVSVDEAGKPVRISGVCQDVTARQRVAAMLEQSHALLHAVVEGIPHPMYVKDRRGRYLLANRAAASAVGKTAEDILGRDDTELFTRTTAERDKAMDRRVIDNGLTQVEEQVETTDGVMRAYLTTKTPYRGPHGEVLGVIGISQDVSEHRQARESLRQYAERLQDLSRQLVAVQEEERRRLARELHDEVGQALTGLQLILERAARAPADQRPDAINEARAMACELLADVRELSLDLRPPMLDDFGLVATLLWYFQRFTSRTGVRVAFRRTDRGERSPAERETAVYRIVQEALTNVARHARVTEAVVRLWSGPAAFYVQIEDSGLGFDAEALRSGRNSGGLRGMRERAELLNGSLTIESAPGTGTRVTAEFPPAAAHPFEDCAHDNDPASG